MSSDFQKNKDRFSNDKEFLKETIIKYLGGHQGGTLSTIRPDGTPQASGISYVNIGLNLYFAMDPHSQKMKNIDHNPNVGFATFKDYHRWDRTRAVQLHGKCEVVTDKAEEEKVINLIVAKWPWCVEYESMMEWAAKAGTVPYCKIIPKGIAYLDYPKFGFNQYVVLDL